MLYLIEINFRFRYFLFSFFLTISTIYHYSDLLLFLVLNKLISPSSNETEIIIYSNPTLLLDLHINVALFFSLIFILPMLLYNILDFLKSSLTFLEFSSFLKAWAFICAVTIYFNLFLCLYFFPTFWISSVAIVNVSTFFSFELRLPEYFVALWSLIFKANICFLSVITFCISFVLFELQIVFYLYKFYLLISVVSAYFLAPSEFHGQVFISIFLIFFLEFVLYLCVLSCKIIKKLTLLSRHYIK